MGNFQGDWGGGGWLGGSGLGVGLDGRRFQGVWHWRGDLELGCRAPFCYLWRITRRPSTVVQASRASDHEAHYQLATSQPKKAPPQVVALLQAFAEFHSFAS